MTGDAPAFTCPDCGHTSHHPKDVEERYCGWCHWWTGDPALRSSNPNPRPKERK